ncbi:hypothetical protein [Candidatus Lokiarchaeum ossiferum]|uniref:hypothetical protein n=1 Tax=Candidatus Lokiarchaeum ossiferum TaxID=2951803 RepID=UPI00352FC74D
MGLAPITLKYWYEKLSMPVFSEIRRHDKNYQVNQIRYMVLKDFGQIGCVRITMVQKRALYQLPSNFLILDTGAISREHAIKILNSFYREPIRNEEKMTVLSVKWLKQYPPFFKARKQYEENQNGTNTSTNRKNSLK